MLPMTPFSTCVAKGHTRKIRWHQEHTLTSDGNFCRVLTVPSSQGTLDEREYSNVGIAVIYSCAAFWRRRLPLPLKIGLDNQREARVSWLQRLEGLNYLVNRENTSEIGIVRLFKKQIKRGADFRMERRVGQVGKGKSKVWRKPGVGVQWQNKCMYEAPCLIPRTSPTSPNTVNFKITPG